MPGLPVVSFTFSKAYRTENPDVQQKWIQTLLRAKGWIVPNYELAPNLSEIEILRVVVRETFSQVLIERLVADIASLLGNVSAPFTHCPVCRLTSPSLLQRLTPRPTLSILLPKVMASVTNFAAGLLTRVPEVRVLAPTPNNVKKE
jgi:hypothetical protein